MRSAGNFHPEWGYLAPAPSFLRTARIALVATAIGATAGATVVVALADRPASNDENSSIAVYAPAINSAAAKIANADAATLAQPPAKAKADPLGSVQSRTSEASTAAHASVPPQTKPISAGSRLPMLASASVPAAVASATQTSATPPPALISASASFGNSPVTNQTEPVKTRTQEALIPEEKTAKRAALKNHRTVSDEATRRRQANNDARQRWRENAGFAPLLRLFGLNIRSPSSRN
jgi:hypothetical protein